MSTLEKLARKIVAGTPDYEALRLARHAFLDTAGCMIAGVASEQLDRFDKGLSDRGPAFAALRGGVAAHALDFDDYEEPGSTHPSAVLVSALLALSREVPVSNGQMLCAYVAGFETILAVGKALGYGHYMAGWHSTSTTGRVGAAMACAHLLGLNEKAAASAMSIGMTQSAGLKAEFGTDTKALHAGLAARTGVEAALLARAGFTAAIGAAEDFVRMYGSDTSPGWDALFAESLPTINIYPPFVKPTPTCGYTIRVIEAGERLSGAVTATEVAAIGIRIPEPYYRVAGFDRPRNVHEARFSVVYCVAAALIDGVVGVNTLTLQALARDDIRALMALTSVDAYALEPGLGDMSPEAPDTVSVEMRDGKLHSETVERVRGGPGRLFSSDEVVTKFVACGGEEATARVFLTAPLDQPFPPLH